jgi:tripartite-type tricarboxylate transporter receptor subunit TctC
MKLQRLIRTTATLMLAFAAATSVSMSVCPAQELASRQSQIVVPVGAGGLNDQLARIVAERLAKELHHPYIVVNKPGANGNIAAAYVAKARPDGDTLLLGAAQMSGSVTLYKSLNYSLEKDLAPVALLARTPYFLAVNTDLPVKSVKDLVAMARAKPNRVSYASTGIGSGGHLLGEALQQQAGIKLTHVPFNSAGQYAPELISGRVDMVFAGLPIIRPYVQSGKLRVLAVTLPQRSPFMPDVPTMSEGGGPPIVDSAWFGLFAPAGTPAGVIDTLSRISRQAMADPQVSERLKAQGAIPENGGPREFAELIHHDVADKAAIIHAAGVSVD